MVFAGDERGVSSLIGALFVFAFVIFALVGAQATVVPSQNKKVEFNHYQAVKDDFQEQRTALINAGETGETRSASVELGTTYPSRAVLLNAPPASGTYRTVSDIGDGNVDSTNLDLTETCGLGTTVPVNHVVYRPSYNYLEVDAEQRYENTVYYQTTDGSELLNRTTQVFIRPNGSGGTVDLYPLQDSFEKSGVDAATVDFVGGETGEVVKKDPSYGTFTIDVPSRISESQWNTTLLPDTDLSDGQDNVDLTVDSNNASFQFTGGNWRVQCHPVGVNEAPDQSSALTPPDDGSDTESQDSGTGGTETWTATNDDTTLSQPGGVFQDIGNADSVELSDPKFTSTLRDGSIKQSEERLRLVFLIEQDAGDVTAGETRYLVVLPGSTGGLKEDLVSSGVDIQNREFKILKDPDPLDDSGYSSFVKATIKQGEADDFYNGSTPLRLLDSGTYSSFDTGGSGELAEVRNFIRNNEVDFYFQDMRGRVRLTAS